MKSIRNGVIAVAVVFSATLLLSVTLKGTRFAGHHYLFLLLGVLVGTGYLSYQRLHDLVHQFLSPTAENADDAKQATRVISKLFLLGAGLISSVLAVDLLVNFQVWPFTNLEWLGTFGDFFGGVVNPILTFISFIALAFSFTLQKMQVSDARKQALESGEANAKQMFETTFFNMLNLQSATVGQLRFSPARVHIDGEASLTELSRYLHGSQEERGRSVFGVVLQAMKEKSEGSESRVPIRPKRQRISLERGDTPKKSPPTAARVYQEIQEKHNYVLGHYFRNLYQVLAYIHASAPVEVDRGNELAPSPKRYSNILRAQLSSDELVALYFNCQGTLVDDGTFRGYLIEYEMLEHMPLEYDKERNALLVKAYAFTADILEYAVVSPSGSIRSAFGKNPDVLEFLKVNPGVVTQTQMPGRWDRLKRQEA